MKKRNEQPAKPLKNELVVTRIFDAPPELVWKAWTEPEHFMKWWGPKDFTSPVCNIDLRIGGKFLFCMRQKSNGKDFWNTGVYKEIIPYEKLVCTISFADVNGNIVPASTHGLKGDFPKEMIMTVTLKNLNGKTEMKVRQVGMPAGEMKEMATIGWNQSLDKLADSLR